MDLDRDVLLAAFLVETDEKVALMEAAVLALESSPGDAGAAVREIFRVAHTIKGNAASLELPALARFSHAVEDLLERLCDGRLLPDAPIVAMLLRTVDVLRAMADDARAAADPEQMPPAGAALIDAIRSILDSGVHRSEPVAIAPPSPRRAKGRSRGTLRIDVAKLDRILDLTGEIAISNKRLAHRLVDTPAGARADAEIASALHTEARRIAELQEHVLSARMLPTRQLFAPFVRIVRDLAQACGKRAKLVFAGGDVEADTAILEELRDPLMHMIRNAIDHGIEPPDARTALGKDPCGTISLAARRAGQSFEVAISDDGKGLDRDRVRARARSRQGATTSPADRDLCQMILEPGFSTAENVTNRSGRGIGLDVVRQTVSALRGSISIESAPGAGFTVTLQLPLTVAILRGFGVRVGAQAFVLPMDSVVECLELPRSRKLTNGASGVVHVREAVLPFIRLRTLFDLPPMQSPADLPDERENLVVVEQGGFRAGIAVDALRGESQAVLKPLGPLFGDFVHADGVVSGSTILEDGGVALVLDVRSLLARARGAVESAGASP